MGINSDHEEIYLRYTVILSYKLVDVWITEKMDQLMLREAKHTYNFNSSQPRKKFQLTHQ